MAEVETKTIKVDDGNESFFIDSYLRFGWKLISSQDVVNKETKSHKYKIDDRVVTDYYTTDDSYVKLVLQRSLTLNNLDGIRKAEEEFWKGYQLKSERISFFPSKGMWIFIGVVVLFGSLYPSPTKFLFYLAVVGLLLLRHYFMYLPKSKRANLGDAMMVSALQDVDSITKD